MSTKPSSPWGTQPLHTSQYYLCTQVVSAHFYSLKKSVQSKRERERESTILREKQTNKNTCESSGKGGDILRLMSQCVLRDALIVT